MKKTVLSKLVVLAGFLCLLSSTALGQQSDSFYLKITHLFQHVEPARVSTGLLKDYGLEFVNVADYDGTVSMSGNRVSEGTWDDLFTSVYTFRFNNVMLGMFHPDSVFKAIRNAGNNGYIPLSLLFWQIGRVQSL